MSVRCLLSSEQRNRARPFWSGGEGPQPDKVGTEDNLTDNVYQAV